MGAGDAKFARAVAEVMERPRKYALVHGEPVPVLEHARWQDWINVTERGVARTDLADDLYVYTWFTGVDHRRLGEPGPPLTFLTEVYRGGKRVEHYRSARLKQAGNTHTAVATRLVAAMEASK